MTHFMQPPHCTKPPELAWAASFEMVSPHTGQTDSPRSSTSWSPLS